MLSGIVNMARLPFGSKTFGLGCSPLFFFFFFAYEIRIRRARSVLRVSFPSYHFRFFVLLYMETTQEGRNHVRTAV
jgi:hypothetical protein